jgi:hypothetical protein
MRKTMLFLAVFALAGSLLAADPIIGTWKLNLAKSKFAPNQPDIPKSGTEAYREVEGGQIELTVTRTDASGSSVLSKYVWPAQGGAVMILQGGPNRITGFVETLIEPGNWYVTCLQNGKQISWAHKTISKDGKTMTQTWKDMDAQGNLIVDIEVFDRQ